MMYQRQKYFNDCGLACLVILFSNYNVITSIEQLSKISKPHFFGSSLFSLIKIAKKIGFQAKAFKDVKKINKLSEDIFMPFIAHVKTTFFGIRRNHYVVISHITDNSIEIWDPDPKKRIYKINHSCFIEMWTGYLLLIIP